MEVRLIGSFGFWDPFLTDRLLFSWQYPETFAVGTRIPLESLKADRFSMEYALVTFSDGQLASDGHCSIVSYDYR